MIVNINFADNNFKIAQKTNSFFAKYIGKVNKTIEYDLKDIDFEFFDKNKKTLNVKRGCGLWLWKPYFIDKTLKSLNENDYLVYSDSGSILIKNINILIKEMESKNLNIFVSFSPFYQKEWTRKYVFDFLNLNNFEYLNTLQPVGGFIILKKNIFSKKFIKEWLELCENYDLIRDKTENEINLEGFKDHRHDQSLLGIIAKKYNLEHFRDLSQFGDAKFYLENFKYFKLEVNYHDFIYSVPTMFFLHRKNYFFIPFVKYILKLILFKIKKT